MDSVLLVDDDPSICRLIERILAARGLSVRSVGTAQAATAVIDEGFQGVALLDVVLPDGTGPALLADFRRRGFDGPVIVLTAHGSADLALRAMRGGAFEFLDKSRLVERLGDVVTAAMARQGALASAGPAGLIGSSPAMSAVYSGVRAAAPSRVPVLVRGEAGAGKEAVARAIHALGPRADQPFIPVNCAGLPSDLVEAELFGHEQGAFTGAVARRSGRFDLAQRGTLFLDEVADLSAELQARLLHMLLHGEYRRVGGDETLTADVRVISATQRDLEALVREGRFREDLFHRLGLYTIRVPALRDRSSDIALLARHFLEKHAAREGKIIRDIDPRALEVLEGLPWAGNVRELDHVMYQVVLDARGPVVGLGDLPASVLLAGPSAEAAADEEVGRWLDPSAFPTLAEVEAQHIRAAVDLARGNKALAARMLGISRMTLYRKLEGQ